MTIRATSEDDTSKQALESASPNHRPLWQIAQEVQKDWNPVNYAAKPYLDAMLTLSSIRDNYYLDSGDSPAFDATASEVRAMADVDNQYYRDFIARKRKEYGERFDASDLDPRFIPYFHSDVRIKVETCGKILTGTIGVTTGWRPAFLLMLRSSSHGSSWLLSRPSDRILAVKHGRKYVEVPHD